MIIDARGITANLAADLCIVGAGAAGMTLALELANAGLTIALLESGGEFYDAETQSLYAGSSIGLQYDPLELSRSRYLGGSSNCWGGWCKPMDPLDFDERPWIPGSGWPFKLHHLGDLYARAHGYLKLGAFDYSEAGWDSELKTKRTATLRLDNVRVANQIMQFSPPVRYGFAYRDKMLRSTDTKLVLWANVTEIDSQPGGGAGVHVQTLSGNRFKVMARSVVLAAGGIENARILLLSRSAQSTGLGNQHDLVGRYFMDHPRVRSTTLQIANLARHRLLYDSRLAKTTHRSGINPNKIAACIVPTPEVQRQRELPNSRTYMVGHYAFDSSSLFQAAMALRTYMFNRGRVSQADMAGLAPLIGGVLGGLVKSPQGAIGMLDRVVNFPMPSRRLTLETVIEPIPNYDSRVTLSHEKDQLGVNRACLDWKLTERDRHNIKATTELVTSELVAQQVATVARGSAGWDGTLTGCWHHMGTTRMHDDPKQGVVDANSRLHGHPNIFCIGSSVFPTASNDCPTLTLVALAIRLADRFKHEAKDILAAA